MKIDFLQMRHQAITEQYCPRLALWVYETSPEYFDWLFGNRELALDHVGSWIRRPTSQFSASEAILALIAENPVGVFIAMPGKDLPARQSADVLALIKTCKSHDERAELMQRLPLLRNMEAPVEQSDFYIRILSVEAARRGAGIGRRLLQKCVEDGVALGFRRFRLDVRTDNTAAIHLYRHFGFRSIRESVTRYSSIDLTIASMVLENRFKNL